MVGSDSAVTKISKLFSGVTLLNVAFKLLFGFNVPWLRGSDPRSWNHTTYAVLGGVRFSGGARCSTSISTFVLPFLSRPTSTCPRAAGTDLSAARGYFL